jgi:PKD repeat protein
VVELYQGDERVAHRRNRNLPCGASPPSLAMAAVAGPGSAGQWSAPFDWPNIAVNLTLLPTGKVLAWGLSAPPYIWDPAAGSFTLAPSPSLLFCAGQTYLPDGRLFVAGGNNNPTAAANGLPNTNLFTPGSQTWAVSATMARGRWYPTTTMLTNGDVVILAGKDETGGTVRIPEVWSSGTLRPLSTASLSLPLYPRTFLAPNGKIFMAGELPGTKYLDPTNTGLWTAGPTRRYGQRDYGAAVMYDQGKILYVGGGRTTNTAEIIDLTAATPAWKWTGAMAFPRRHLNATVLPTGDVLVTGGSSGITFNDYTAPVHAAELWNPGTGLWTTLASNTVNRVYHSTSILLPDGRVLHAGSGDAGPDQRSGELFSPPYLFNGPRPAITSAPTQIAYGSTFSITTPDAATVTKVSLIRLGSTTHAFDMNQRFQWLSFTSQTGALTVSAPTIPNRAPPGHYMVFILNGSGVPSVAKIVQLGDVSGPPPPPPPSNILLGATGRIDPTHQYLDLTWTGAAGSTVDLYLNGAFRRTNSNTGHTTITRTFTGAATYGLKVCEAGASVCSNVATVSFAGAPPPPIALSATGRSDATHQYLDLTWTGIKGTSADIYLNGKFRRTASNTGRTSLTITFAGNATYRLKLCETASIACSPVATVQFGAGSSPPNVAPTAKFTASCTDLTCTFTDGSADWDGTVSQWQWAFGDGSSSSVQNPSHAYGAGGTYTVTLVVKDNSNAAGTISNAVTVTAPPPPNQPPTASFSSSCTGFTCSFTDGSTDDGSIAAWSWDFGDNSGTSTDANPSYTYAAAGDFTVSLTVTDNTGKAGTTSQLVTATAPPPTTAAFISGCTNLSCSFTDESTAAGGAALSWGWDFGDGSSSTERNPSHAYAAGGTYQVILTVTDSKTTSSVTHPVDATP